MGREDTPMATRAERVLERIRDIPPGFVRAYGDVSPGAPRFAGTVLSACEDPDVPWHRVVRADGSLAKGARQRALLEAEDVPFRGERVDMPWRGCPRSITRPCGCSARSPCGRVSAASTSSRAR